MGQPLARCIRRDPPNTYVGLKVALAVFNPEGGAVAALVMAIMIPSINVLCVLVLNLHAGGNATVGGLYGLIGNPLILACLAGRLNLSGIGFAGIGGDTGDSGAGGVAAGLAGGRRGIAGRGLGPARSTGGNQQPENCWPCRRWRGHCAG